MFQFSPHISPQPSWKPLNKSMGFLFFVFGSLCVCVCFFVFVLEAGGSETSDTISKEFS